MSKGGRKGRGSRSSTGYHTHQPELEATRVKTVCQRFHVPPTGFPATGRARIGGRTVLDERVPRPVYIDVNIAATNEPVIQQQQQQQQQTYPSSRRPSCSSRAAVARILAGLVGPPLPFQLLQPIGGVLRVSQAQQCQSLPRTTAPGTAARSSSRAASSSYSCSS